MTVLSRLFSLAVAKESSPAANGVATYAAGVRWIPATSPKPEDVILPLRDESLRGNDTVVQGIYQGPSNSTFDYTLPHLYPDVLGDHLRAIIGPDTVTAGISTTLSATVAAGASSITTAASIPLGSTVRIDTGAKIEYFTTGTPTGAGPFTIPVTATGTGSTLAQGHTAGVAVVSATTHTFAQDQRATPIPSYSLTMYNGVETRGFPGCIESDLNLKIDPKGAASCDAKWMGFPSAVQSTVGPAFSNIQPFIGWQWSMNIGGAVSTRGISADITWKRATEVVDASDGTQYPREIWPGALECDVKFKAIFENNVDFTNFQQPGTTPLITTLTQPLSTGGSVLTVTNTGLTLTKFVTDFSTQYLTADVDASGTFNTTDNGVSKVVLKNFVSSQY